MDVFLYISSKEHKRKSLGSIKTFFDKTKTPTKYDIFLSILRSHALKAFAFRAGYASEGNVSSSSVPSYFKKREKRLLDSSSAEADSFEMADSGFGDRKPGRLSLTKRKILKVLD